MVDFIINILMFLITSTLCCLLYIHCVRSLRSRTVDRKLFKGFLYSIALKDLRLGKVVLYGISLVILSIFFNLVLMSLHSVLYFLFKGDISFRVISHYSIVLIQLAILVPLLWDIIRSER